MILCINAFFLTIRVIIVMNVCTVYGFIFIWTYNKTGDPLKITKNVSLVK